MKLRALVLCVGASAASVRLFAQCPDGTPPPCARASVATTSRVAVLPFENRARDTSLTLLAEGLADQITTNLGRVRRLEVTAPASVRFVLARTPREPARLGRALGSRWLVDGQLLSSAGNVRVSVQLIEAASQRVRWTGAFQRPTEDLFAVISAVADSVATAIIGTLAPAERASLVRRPTTSNAALVAYTRGVAGLHYYDEPHVRDAVAAFERATAADSTFAQAWAGLAEALIWQDAWSPPRRHYPRAYAFARHALALAPGMAAATATLSAIAQGYEWNTLRSESLARRAVQLDSTYGRAWVYLADALTNQSRFDEAVPLYYIAMASDTLDEQIATQAAGGLHMARRTDDALALIRRWRRRMPRSEIWEMIEAQVLIAANRCVSSPPPSPIGALALACAGRAAAARAAVDTTVAQVERGEYYVPPGWIAVMYVGLGDREAALRWFARAVDARTYLLSFARVDPIWNSLRGDPRFQQLLETMHPIELR